ncbi:porin [Chelatococcus sp. SYSU_G07232]|uniref:Porin n=1 Tax=Chelatococcus albus TaxID=3047466 RepID=A0ABT7AFW4_9HYPH|nr:porin [Chelatococcus sp. SYSU_G07232]MDJ1157897.1 porin [Chelatococcus sp. SYSU_G07232]
MRAAALMWAGLFVWVSGPALAAFERPPRLAVPICAFETADEEEADDTGEDEADSDEDTVGFFRIAPATCLRISGSVDSGLLLSWAGGYGVSSGLGRFLPVTRYDIKATLAVETRQQFESFDLTSLFEVEMLSTGSTTITNAYVEAGPVTAGIATSFFDYWSADSFLFRALASSQSPALLAGEWSPSGTLSVALAMEDPVVRRVVPLGYAGTRAPDVVARLKVEPDWGEVQLSAALRYTRFASLSAATATGWAVQLGATLPVEALGAGDELVLQAAYARNAPGYLGIYTASGVSGFTLPASLLAEAAELTAGWNAAVSYEHHWSKAWRSNIFVTMVDLRLREVPGKPDVTVWRSAANLLWSPVEGLDVGIELGYFRSSFSRRDRAAAAILNADRWTLQASLSRSF